MTCQLTKMGKSAIGTGETSASDLFSELEQADSLLGDSEPLPEWMSEKVSLASWLEAVDTKPSDLVMESSLPLDPSKLDLGTSLEVPIPSEELLDTLIVDTRFAPQPPSPGEAQAPDLLALSPANSLFGDDASYSSPSPSPSIGSPVSPSSSNESPASPFELVQEPAASTNHGDVNLTTIDASELLKSIVQSPTITSGDIPLNINGASIEVRIVIEPPTCTAETPPAVEMETPKQKSRARPKVKSVSDPVIKKSKKRDQNKRAATRYRHKKRSEQEVLEDERDGLEKTNKDLNDKVDSISREIKYLKDLLAEVYKVKGEIKVMQKR
ncbi:uncharacterized protein [Amphiura filiformis]|uniref:uncharacterized protein n=1 Tax=Amphiura filiformis TaxID=82378 RepID=UPI003B227963